MNKKKIIKEMRKRGYIAISLKKNPHEVIIFKEFDFNLKLPIEDSINCTIYVLHGGYQFWYSEQNSFLFMNSYEDKELFIRNLDRFKEHIKKIELL